MSPSKVRFRKDRDAWEADYRDHTGRRHRITARTKKAAHDRLNDAIHADKQAEERAHGVPLADDPMTFARYADHWLNQLTVEAKTLAGYRQYLRLYVNPTLGKKRVGSIAPKHINRLLSTLRETRAPATVRQAKSVLTQCLSLATLEGYLPSNPVLSVPRVRTKTRKPKVRALTSTELARLLTAALEPYRTLFTLMATTGLRPGEAYALQPGDVDLEAGTMRIERSVSIHDQTIKGTKTDEEREVELSSKTVSMLKAHIWLNDTAIRETGYIFTSEAGTLLDHNNVSKRFTKALKAAKLPHFSLYDLRHSYGALMLSAGAPLLYVSEQMGHSDASITLKYYATWMPKTNDRQANRWDLEPIWNQTPQVGEPRRNRTFNLRIKSPLLCQLS